MNDTKFFYCRLKWKKTFCHFIVYLLLNMKYHGWGFYQEESCKTYSLKSILYNLVCIFQSLPVDRIGVCVRPILVPGAYVWHPWHFPYSWKKILLTFQHWKVFSSDDMTTCRVVDWLQAWQAACFQKQNSNSKSMLPDKWSVSRRKAISL